MNTNASIKFAFREIKKYFKNMEFNFNRMMLPPTHPKRFKKVSSQFCQALKQGNVDAHHHLISSQLEFSVWFMLETETCSSSHDIADDLKLSLVKA